MNKKYFFFDIDGTLSDDATKKIVPSAKRTLELLQQEGHFVAIATGRAYYKAKAAMEEIGISNMVCNGGKGIVVNEKLIENAPLPKRKALAIIQEATELGYGVLVALDDSYQVYSTNHLFHQQAGLRKEPTRYTINAKLKYEEHDIYKIYVSIPKDKEHQLTLLDTVGHLRYEENYLMFQHDNKKEGILKMLKYIGGESQNVVVFGDDYNDLDMFDDLWYSVAMGNACDELKKKANYITDANIDDGIYNACHKMGWIKPTR